MDSSESVFIGYEFVNRVLSLKINEIRRASDTLISQIVILVNVKKCSETRYVPIFATNDENAVMEFAFNGNYAIPWFSYKVCFENGKNGWVLNC